MQTTIDYLRRQLFRTFHFVETMAILAVTILAVGQASPLIEAQSKTGRQPTATTPPAGKQVGGLKDAGVEIDFDNIARKITAALAGKTAGYGFAVFHNGQLQKHGAGGYAKRSPDKMPGSETPFSEYSRIEIASSTKTVTAIAVLKALESKGKTDAEWIYTYLPTTWNIPNSVKELTFRDVLSHHSGLKKVSDGTYDGVRKSIEAGVSPDYEEGAGDYQNINYALCRVLLPYIVASPQMKASEGDPKAAAILTASTFAHFVRDHVFKPAGVSQLIQFQPWDESNNLDNLALLYNYKATNVAGMLPSIDPPEKAGFGPGGLFINAVELAQIMSALENDKLFALKTRLMMKQHELGIFRYKETAYWSHNGGFGDSKGRGCSTRLVLCPNNIQVVILINSGGNDCANTFNIVKDAVDSSVSKP